jgi:hypothetical protein
MNNAERARRYKASLAERGLIQVNVWLPAAVASDFKRAAELVANDPHLTVARLMDRRTGRLRGLK